MDDEEIDDLVKVRLENFQRFISCDHEFKRPVYEEHLGWMQECEKCGCWQFAEPLH